MYDLGQTVRDDGRPRVSACTCDRSEDDRRVRCPGAPVRTQLPRLHDDHWLLIVFKVRQLCFRSFPIRRTQVLVPLRTYGVAAAKCKYRVYPDRLWLVREGLLCERAKLRYSPPQLVQRRTVVEFHYRP
jgi:hypothetical protein